MGRAGCRCVVPGLQQALSNARESSLAVINHRLPLLAFHQRSVNGSQTSVHH